MIQEESMASSNKGRVYDFMEHRKKRPYFTKPVSIHIGDPLNETYQLARNIVYNGKQILGVNKQSEPTVILLVEAIIENGELKNVRMIPNRLMEEVKGVFLQNV
ncbi:MAG TPA: hypothetical protein VJ824_16285 [Bacillota bacterium]|nr:hypothetical protein [Bacillota bacterium]